MGRKTKRLSNILLLLDEPETHLHPQAQRYLTNELIEITKRSDENNVIYFATHSNHMIDKEHVERCYKFSKQYEATEVKRANKGIMQSYAEVNYSVFETAGNDYHDELYGYLASTKERLGEIKRIADIQQTLA